MKELYAVVTNQCDLSCPHCDIKSQALDNYNEELFINTLKEFDGNIILFGGEPTLHKDRLLKILSLNKAMSISTNLVNLDKDFIPYFKNLYVATSWNHLRFTYFQYRAWLNNLKLLHENEISCRVLITLTKDLIQSSPTRFIEMVKIWNSEYKAIDSIAFEQLIDNTKSKEFYERADDWLCKVHNLWKKHDIKIENLIINKLDHWYCDCDNVYTLQPNGEIINRCPHSFGICVVSECLTCPQSETCRPCRLQQHCTYPKKLAQLVKQE